MAAGRPKQSLESLKLCFEMSTAKTLKMQVWMAMDHPKQIVGAKLCFGGLSVVAAALLSKEQEWPLLVCKTF